MVKRGRSQNARQWRAIKNLKRNCAPEIKFKDAADAQALAAGAFAFVNPITISQGDGFDERIGNEVCIKHLKFQCRVINSAANVPSSFFFALVRINSGTVAPPFDATDFANTFEYTTFPRVMYSPLFSTNARMGDTYEVLWKKAFTFSNIQRVRTVTLNKSFNFKSVFLDNAATQPYKGQLGIVIGSDDASNYNYTLRLKWTDA